MVIPLVGKTKDKWHIGVPTFSQEAFEKSFHKNYVFSSETEANKKVDALNTKYNSDKWIVFPISVHKKNQKEKYYIAAKRENRKEDDETMRWTDWGILMFAPPVIVWEVFRDFAKLKGRKLWLTWLTFWFVFILLIWFYIKFF